jgi:hypothetical protein
MEIANEIIYGPLTTRLKREASWNDEYPAWQDFADECETLLEFLRVRGALDRYWPRLRARRQQRDEAINEMRVAHYLESAGYPVSDWSEPQDAPGYNVEFAISLSDARSAVVEVKSPGWESELSEPERKQGRAQQPKFIGGRGGPSGPVGVIRRAVEKARPKFSGSIPSLVVISDDCFVNLGEWGWGPLQMALSRASAAYGAGLFQKDEFANVGAVCTFWLPSYFGKGIEHKSICMANPSSTSPQWSIHPIFRVRFFRLR